MKYCIYILSIALLLGSFNSYAQIDDLSKAINESGRLRMLTQRLSKAYLLKNMDIQPGKAQLQFLSGIEKFDDNLKELTDFSKQTHNPAPLLVTLDLITQEWQGYQAALAKDLDKNNVDDLLLASDRTLLACEELVNQFEKVAEVQSAQWVNISGRQRMLSQRIAKLYSAISYSDGKGIDQAHISELEEAVSEFDLALNKLLKSPVNTHFVNHKLKKVATQWDFSKQGFKLLNKGSSTPLVIAMTTETMLKQMNDITALYEALAKKQKS
jgi:nitrate/nitrite-specific signal transduction histidine kinase